MSTIDRSFCGLPIADMKQAESWYTSLFGRAPDLTRGPDVRIWFEGDGGLIVFLAPDRAGSGSARIVVPSLDRERALLVERGLKPCQPKLPGTVGLAHLEDVDGNQITLAERHLANYFGDNSQVVRRFFEAFRDRRADIAEAMLADDFTFTSPFYNHIDRQAFLTKYWHEGSQFPKMWIDRITADREGAYVTYFAATKAGEQFSNTEYFRVTDGQLSSADSFFGANYIDGKFFGD